MADVRDEVATAVDAMKAWLDQLQQAKEAHEQRTRELRSTVVRKLTELREADYPAALELAQDLYWTELDVRVSDLEDGLGLVRNHMHKVAGLGPVMAHCPGCGAERRPASRSQAGYQPGGPGLREWCSACWPLEQERRVAHHRQSQAGWEQRRQQVTQQVRDEFAELAPDQVAAWAVELTDEHHMESPEDFWRRMSRLSLNLGG